MKQQLLTILRYSLLVALVATLATSFVSCGGKDKPEPPAEANLVVSLDPDPGSTTTPVVAMGSSYDFRVKVESAMPAQGVDITVVYRKDDVDKTVVFAQTYTTKTSPQAVTVTGIPFNQVGTVTVTVVSKTKPDNTVQKTFRLVKK